MEIPTSNIQHRDNLTNAEYYYNSALQLYLDPQGVYCKPGVTGAYVTQNRNTREQPVFKRTQLDPSVMPHVDGNCHWGRQTYEEIALDALAAYTIDREYTEETVGDRNIILFRRV